MNLTSSAPAMVMVAFLFSTGMAAAQTIYRCGNSYSRAPCPEGQALDVGDPRSAAQRAEAQRVAAAEKRLGDAMASDRRRAEAEAQPAGPASLSPVRPASAPIVKKTQAAPKDKKRRPLSDAEARGDFVAGVPGSGRKASAPL